ncbi:MAG: hypothetical protein KIT68_06585, partial [Phycisphaeraceae bacterium]|nr:hypothetical protein [Phycisphaeraceae bacterium]
EPRRVLRPPQDVLVQHKSAEAAAKAGVGQRYAEARAVSLALTPDGQTVALGFADGTIRLLRATDGKEIASMLASTLRRQGVRDLAFDAAGRRLVSVTEVAAQVWDAGTGRPVSSVPAFMPGYGSTLTPDGRALAVMNPLTALIQLWTTDDNRRRLVLATLSSRVDPRGHVMQLNASGTRAAISLGDGTIQVWNVEPPEQTPADGVLRERERLVATLPGHAAPVNAIAFRPDRAGMASVSTDGQLRLWDGDLLGRAVVRQRSGDAGDPLTLGNGRIAFRDEGRLRVLDAVTRAEVGAVPIANERACFDPGSGDLLLVRDGKVLSRYAGDTLRLREQVGAADALPGRLRLALRARADDPGARCEVVDQATGRVIARLACGVAITPSPSGVRGEISASGQVAAIRPRDDLVEFYALPTGEQLGVATVPSGARVIAMSNDGRSAAVLDGGRGVLLIETQGARLRKRIDAGTSPVDASFSPDGRRLAVLLADGTVRLLEADGLTEMLVLRSGAIQPQVVAFSPDGAVIAIAGPQDVVAWTVPPPASPAGGP